MGHEGVICYNKIQQHSEEAAQIVEQHEEDHLSVATCFAGSETSKCWLIDSGKK
jgi:hypothetical protein